MFALISHHPVKLLRQVEFPALNWKYVRVERIENTRKYLHLQHNLSAEEWPDIDRNGILPLIMGTAKGIEHRLA
ncbi:MAG: hypothetical protein GWN14_16235 [candidate division Zixibacteria bacterium]|nr:hypothetical protein [Gammaproteobacteria bacterium]NIX57425.1 hypothetical protein [candidate division Zixibacteria bacterium]